MKGVKTMICRQVRTNHYESLRENITNHARRSPLCPFYEMDISVNETQYTLFVQMEKRQKVYALYAICNECEQVEKNTLITDNSILSALMELAIYEWVNKKKAD